MTDELDLIGELGGAEPLRPEAHQRARALLRAAMADPGTVRLPDARSPEDNTMKTTSTTDPTPRSDQGLHPALRRRRRIGTAGRLGIGAGVAVAAAAAVVALVVSSSTTGGTTAAQGPAASAAGSATVSGSADSGPLLTLAAYVKTNAPSTGDAWLVISTQVDGGKTMQVLYALYTDSHEIYLGDSVNGANGIKHAIARHQDQGPDSGYAPLVKAATFAANSSLADGRTQMLRAAGNKLVGLDPAAQKVEWDKEQADRQAILKMKHSTATPEPYSPQAVQRNFDNDVWTSSTEALTAGNGNTLVRQGVLRLLSTVPGVSAAHSTTNGTATLTITNGSTVSGEVLTIDATTGMLVKDVSNVPGIPQAYTTYQSSRVTTANL